MSDDQENGKAAEAPAPPQPEDADSRTTKSYKELMLGFEEIRRIVDNQDKFDKRKNAVNNCDEILKNFEKIKKIVDDQENPAS